MSDQYGSGNSDASGNGPWNSPDDRRPHDDRPYGEPGQYGQNADSGRDQGGYGGSAYPQQSYDNTPSYSQTHTDQQHGAQAYGGGYGHAAPLSQGMAVAALVCGVIALLTSWFPVLGLIGVLLAIIAVILGIVALRKVAKRTGGGKGLAIAGLVTGLLALVIGLAVNALMFAALSEAARDPNGQQVIECLQKTNQAEQQACLERAKQNLPTQTP